MRDLPARISDWLLLLVTTQRAVAYLVIDAAHTLADAGGDLQRYGLADLRRGEAASRQLPVLEGLLPLPETPFLLQAVGMPSGRVADLHFTADGDATWVVLLDVTPEHDEARKVQQKAYDMTLLSQREARLIARLETAHADLTRAHHELAESRDSLLRAHQRLQRELRDAERYVRAILPGPMTAPFAVDWRFVPSTELGGDSFGYHWIDGDHFALYLLDVCGHGVGAALLSVAVTNVLRSGALPHTDFRRPEEVLAGLNRAYQMEDHDGMYFTIWYGVYQPRNGRLRYASAGHPPPLLVSGPPDQPGDATALMASGLLLGMLPSTQYDSEERTLVGPARLFLFSDGVYEINRPDDTMLPFSAFQEVLTRAVPADRSELDELLTFAREVRGAPLLEDDFSIVKMAI
jgi:serine phosphatase RsbU (regulator of sigma subunit)